MFKRGRSVDSFISMNTPIGKYPLLKQCDIGELLGINAKGELVSAEKDQIANEITRVVGVVTEGSTVTIDDKRYLPNGKNYKEAGDFQDLYREFKLLNVTNCQIGSVNDTFTWSIKDIGTPVYITSKTDGGTHTAILTTHLAGIVAGKKYQEIGYLGDPTRKEIIVVLTNDIITKA